MTQQRLHLLQGIRHRESQPLCSTSPCFPGDDVQQLEHRWGKLSALQLFQRSDQKFFLRELHGELEIVWVLFFTKSLFFLLHSDFSSLSPLFFFLLHVCSFSSVSALGIPLLSSSPLSAVPDTPWSWWLMTISE